MSFLSKRIDDQKKKEADRRANEEAFLKGFADEEDVAHLFEDEDEGGDGEFDAVGSPEEARCR